MTDIIPGTPVRIECDVHPGPFSGERLISFNSLEGQISGFAKENELSNIEDKWYVPGVVQAVNHESLTVKVRGSFFTTNGIATVPITIAMAA